MSETTPQKSDSEQRRDRVRDATDKAARAGKRRVSLTVDDARWLLYDHVEDRMRRAVRDLESAASSAEMAVADAQVAADDLLGRDEDGDDPGPGGVGELREAVLRWHDDEHHEAARFCTEPCRVAAGFGVDVGV